MPGPTIAPPVLCLVTDRSLCNDASLVHKVTEAVEGGVNIIQLREKDLPGRLLLDLANQLQKAIEGRALLVVNERVDVALLSSADGIHLGESALTPSDARSLAGNKIIVGRSVHDYAGALQAQQQGADYLVAGSVYPTRSHLGQTPQGLPLIEELASRITIPFLGIGGINCENAAAVIRAGASGVAVISAILASSQPREAALRLNDAISEAWQTRKGAPT